MRRLVVSEIHEPQHFSHIEIAGVRKTSEAKFL